MSIRERLRKSSSIQDSFNPSSLSTGENSDGRVVTDVVLSCDDVSTVGDVHREYKLVRGMHRAVDFFRTSSANSTGRMYVAEDGAARAAFSSPVMSRKHARITFARDGSVTIMDLGSMHGTYLGGVNFEDLLPEKLKPRRHYTLRSGDTILLGKHVNRDERDWKPVTIRVVFTHVAGAGFVSPPPNRYGLFIDPTGGSDSENSAFSVSSSSCGEEDDDQSQTGTSPASSPVGSHVPLQLDGVISTTVSRESLVSGSRVADDTTPVPGVFDLNRTISATGALRAILPPIPNIQSAIRRLPSLRELGFFNGTNTTCGSTAEQVMGDICDDIHVPTADSNIGAGEADASMSTPFDPFYSSQPYNTHVDSHTAAAEEVREEDASCSTFPWQEPSHPQNQLGLEVMEPSDFHEETSGEKYQGDKPQDPDGSENGQALPPVNTENAKENVELKEIREKSMEISPTSSRSVSPSFHASGIFSKVDESSPASTGLDETLYCCCHEEAEEQQPQEVGQENNRAIAIDARQDVEARTPAAVPAPMPVVPTPLSSPATPENRRMASNLTTPPSAADLRSGRRRARDTRSSIAYGAIPSPVSIGKRGKRHGARLGPTRLSPTPNPPGPFGRVGRIRSDKTHLSRYPPHVDALRTKVRSLESRMKDIQESAIMMSSFASAPTNGVTSSSAVSIDEARKELESMRGEMRRLSGLIESLVTKMEARTNSSNDSDPGMHTKAAESPETLSRAGSKRKRSDDVEDSCTLRTYDLEAARLMEGLDLQVQRPSSMKEKLRSFYEPNGESDVHPVKRARVGGNAERRAVTTVAAAAGYTSLGAALTWVVLAYVL